MFVRAWRGNRADDEGGVMEAGAYAGGNAEDVMRRHLEEWMAWTTLLEDF